MKRKLKGWGWEDWIVNNQLYCGKILHFKKGKRCSLHYHKIKDETFYVLKGSILLDDGKKTLQLNKGEIIRLKPLKKHRIFALKETDILEISTQHFESDSYRLEVGDK